MIQMLEGGRVRKVENLEKVGPQEIHGLIVVDSKVVESINGSEVERGSRGEAGRWREGLF